MQYGFGLSTVKSAAPVLGGDPNTPLYEQLSEADRGAYDLALAGEVHEALVVLPTPRLVATGPVIRGVVRGHLMN